MAEDEGMTGSGEPIGNGEDTLPQVGLISQYVKDLSFENPNAPAVYQWQGQPQIDVQFNIGAQQLNEELHEVARAAISTISATSCSSSVSCWAPMLNWTSICGWPCH